MLTKKDIDVIVKILTTQLAREQLRGESISGLSHHELAMLIEKVRMARGVANLAGGALSVLSRRASKQA